MHFQGGGPLHVYSTDGEGLFKQDSYFFYLFGVSEDSWYGSVDLGTGRATLFMPRLPESYAVWMGPLKRYEHEADGVHESALSRGGC